MFLAPARARAGAVERVLRSATRPRDRRDVLAQFIAEHSAGNHPHSWPFVDELVESLKQVARETIALHDQQVDFTALQFEIGQEVELLRLLDRSVTDLERRIEVSSMDSIPPRGCEKPWRSYPLASTDRSIRCCRCAPKLYTTALRKRMWARRALTAYSPRSPLDKQKGVQGSQYTSVAFGQRCIEGWYNPRLCHSLQDDWPAMAAVRRLHRANEGEQRVEVERGCSRLIAEDVHPFGVQGPRRA
jgi:hypothetical protein